MAGLCTPPMSTGRAVRDNARRPCPRRSHRPTAGDAHDSTKSTGRVPPRVKEFNADPLAGWGVRKVVLFGGFFDPNIQRVVTSTSRSRWFPYADAQRNSLTPPCAAGCAVVGGCNRVFPYCSSM